MTVKKLDDQRVSSVVMYHGVIDPLDSATSVSNYRKVTAEADARGYYGEDQIKEIYQPWLGLTGSDNLAAAVVGRLLDRYQDTPQQITFSADIVPPTLCKI